jgi:hypothetical protein
LEVSILEELGAAVEIACDKSRERLRGLRHRFNAERRKAPLGFSQALRAALPIYCVFLITITFMIFFPRVVLWLPKQVLPESVGCFKNASGTGYICPQ